MAKKNKPDANGIIYSTDTGFSFGETGAFVETLHPADQKLKVKLDTKHRAGKAVTLIEGFAGAKVDLDKLGKKLQSFCGSGGSFKDGQIMIQGDHQDKVVQWLIKWGYRQSRKIG
jgi:translation initiation factor 1